VKVQSRILALICAISLTTVVNADVIEKGPYLQNPDTAGITICWVTDFISTSVVEYGLTSELGGSLTVEVGRRNIWNAGGDDDAKAFHQVRVDNLQAGTQYYYRVRSGDVVSATHTFSTSRKPGNSVRFVAFGDTRPTDNHRNVMGRISAIDPAPDFLLHTGDMVSNGQRWPDWKGFFDIEGPVLADIPIYPAAGNHEKDAEEYYQLFALPDTERWYSFDYGDVHVVTLNSNHEYRDSDAQREWLVRDLRAAYDKPYIFVQFHHPPYTSVNQFHRRVAYLELQRTWAPLFEAAEVTAVFNGHDHNYQHNLVNGVHYVVTGGGGASIYEVRPRDFTVHAAPVYHVTQVDVGESEAVFTVLKADDGAIIERFAIPRRDTSPLQYEAGQ
jgi:acid phosphatase type 7